MNILIFSGTTEGREISERLLDMGHRVTVSVATEFGRAVQESQESTAAVESQGDATALKTQDSYAALKTQESPERGEAHSGRVRILTGRMDESEMTHVIAKYDLCIDATHPYAELAGANIRKAAREAGVRLLRLGREKSPVPEGAYVCGSAVEAAACLEHTEGRILLLSGVKSLPAFSRIARERLIVRIIPSAESLEQALKAGILPAHVIAAEGPFSTASNELLIREKCIRFLVTKDGGKAGGFPEKAEACRRCGTRMVLIRRPEGREGLTMEEILEKVGRAEGPSAAETGTAPGRAGIAEPEHILDRGSEATYSSSAGEGQVPAGSDMPRARICLIGCGSGDPGQLSGQASDIVRSADLVIGSPRLLSSLSGKIRGEQASMYRTDEIVSLLRDRIAAFGHQSIRGQTDSADCCLVAAVLLSGDTGFFSGAASLSGALDREHIPYTILPGISSMAMLAAKLHTTYTDWNIISLHGQSSDEEQVRSRIIQGMMSGRRTFYLTGGYVRAGLICRVLADAGLSDLRVTVGENLFTGQEKVTFGTAEELTDIEASGMAVVLAEAAPYYPVQAGGLEDSHFIRGKVPMTKQFVRAAILSGMGIRDGETVWDIGAGTGSVSVEMALLDRRGRVFAVEKDPEGVRLIRENRRKFSCWNLDVREGTAPEALEGLPAPDRVFIGGSGRRLEDIVGLVLAVSPHASVTLTTVTLETLGQATELFRKLGRPYQAVQIAVSSAVPMGSYHLMKAENPVFLIHSSCTGEAEERS